MDQGFRTLGDFILYGIDLGRVLASTVEGEWVNMGPPGFNRLIVKVRTESCYLPFMYFYIKCFCFK